MLYLTFKNRRDKICFFFFFSSRRRHTRLVSDWSSDVCSSDLDMEVSSLNFDHADGYSIRAGGLHTASRSRYTFLRIRWGGNQQLSRTILCSLSITDNQIGRASCRERV